jgi:hypothetical protein
MKIEAKFTADEIFYLERKLEKFQEITPSEFVRYDRKQKSKTSLFIDCYEKIHAKSESIKKKQEIFSSKEFKVGFKYHEATIINNLCCSLKSTEPVESHFWYLANAIYINLDAML